MVFYLGKTKKQCLKPHDIQVLEYFLSVLMVCVGVVNAQGYRAQSIVNVACWYGLTGPQALYQVLAHFEVLRQQRLSHASKAIELWP